MHIYVFKVRCRVTLSELVEKIESTTVMDNKAVTAIYNTSIKLIKSSSHISSNSRNKKHHALQSSHAYNSSQIF